MRAASKIDDRIVPAAARVCIKETNKRKIESSRLLEREYEAQYVVSWQININ